MANVAIRTAIERILSGSIRIPAFQRGFVWTTDNISFLMDSIYRNYPIGNILLWRTREPLEKERDLGPFSLPNPEKEYPVDYVLDGQQRLTSIFSVFQTSLTAGSSTEAFDIYFDLQAPEGALEDQFVSIFEPESVSSRYFPLRAVFDTARFFEMANDLSSDDKINEPDILRAVRPIEPSFFMENRFAIGNVNSKILINILSQKKPVSLLSGANIDLSVVLQNANKNEFHHIFPKAHLRRSGADNDKINAIANICFLSKSDNIRIKDKSPSEYVAMMTISKKEAILDTNLIPVDFSELEYNDFLSQRSLMIANYANSLAGFASTQTERV